MSDQESAADRARRHLSRTPPIVPPIYQSTIFLLDDVSCDDVIETGGLNEDWYSRFRNPTVATAAEQAAHAGRRARRSWRFCEGGRRRGNG